MNHENENARRLRELAQSLPVAEAAFYADDVRVRLGRAAGGRRWARWGIAAAAVLALAVSHAGAFLLGGRDRVSVTEAPDPMIQTERILTRAAQLDPGAPPQLLSDELGALRREIQLTSLPRQLRTLQAGPDSRASRLANALVQFDQVFELVNDPGLRAVMAVNIARVSLHSEGSVRMLPGSAKTYTRVVPLHGGTQFRVWVLDPGRNRVLVDDQGTVDDLRKRHPNIRFVSGDPK